MSRLLRAPKKEISDHDWVMSILLDSDLETKEEWDLMKNALYAALDWGKKHCKK